MKKATVENIQERIAMRSYERINMADGNSVSMQARFPQGFAGTYAKFDDVKDRWTHVELGFPTFIPEDYLLEYVEDYNAPMDTVYPYVPVEVVVKFINEHGGYA
jgi:hypothetical protein